MQTPLRFTLMLAYKELKGKEGKAFDAIDKWEQKDCGLYENAVSLNSGKKR